MNRRSGATPYDDKKLIIVLITTHRPTTIALTNKNAGRVLVGHCSIIISHPFLKNALVVILLSICYLLLLSYILVSVLV